VRAVIFLNGAPDSPELLRRVAEGADLVLAADGGARNALDANIVPDLVLGDMDSLGDAGVREMEERGVPLERHPARKDKMDGHLAVIAARERGATVLDLLCASGEMFSALFALPHLLLAAEQMGLRAAVVAGWGRAFVVEAGSRAVIGAPGDGVSVFPLAGTATGVSLEGFAYPLEYARMETGDTLGFHNELLDLKGRVSVREGVLLVIHEMKEVHETMTTEELLDRHATAWRDAIRHPFLDGVRDGDLPAGAFERWLVQDYIVVADMLVFQARLIARSPRRDQGTLISGLAAAEAELGWFEDQASKWEFPLDAPRHPNNIAYRDFLRGLGDEPYVAGLTALWALERTYLEAWRGVAPGAPDHRPFVEHWTTPEFAEYVAELERLTEAALGAADGEERRRAEEAFVSVARLERDFWEMAFPGGRG